jgi:hypothetical protein
METKKILAAVAAASLIVAACNKSQQPDPGSQTAGALTQNTTAAFAKVKDPKNKPNGVYQTSGQWAGWCSPSAQVNCKMLKMVTVSAYTLLNQLEGASGAALASAMDNPELIDFTESIPSEYLDKIKSGEYLIHMNAESETEINYIFGKLYPVNNENLDFSIQVIKGN